MIEIFEIIQSDAMLQLKFRYFITTTFFFSFIKIKGTILIKENIWRNSRDFSEVFQALPSLDSNPEKTKKVSYIKKRIKKNRYLCKIRNNLSFKVYGK